MSLWPYRVSLYHKSGNTGVVRIPPLPLFTLFRLRLLPLFGSYFSVVVYSRLVRELLEGVIDTWDEWDVSTRNCLELGVLRKALLRVKLLSLFSRAPRA